MSQARRAVPLHHFMLSRFAAGCAFLIACGAQPDGAATKMDPGAGGTMAPITSGGEPQQNDTATGGLANGGTGSQSADGSGGMGTDPPSSTPSGRCAAPAVAPLFSAADGKIGSAIVEERSDGVLVTRGAGRVRGRHELEGTYSTYGARYFENRSYGFTIEDAVAAGGNTVTFTYEPEATVSTNGAQTNFRFWKILGDGNVFHSNVGMERLSPKQLRFVVDRNARAERDMRVGDVLEFEFGIFIAGNGAGDPDAIEGRTAYYTDTFRYRVGVGGLTAENTDPSGTMGPSSDALLAGDTTIPYLYAEPDMALSQMALNTQKEHVQAFLGGRRLFHTDFSSGEHSEPGNPVFSGQGGKLGPLHDASACVDCHDRDGRGGLPEVGQPLASFAVKLYGPASLGSQLQQQEGEALLERFEMSTAMFVDGSIMALRRPQFTFSAATPADIKPSIRVARQLPGMGLLEAIDEHAILDLADAEDCDGDGISGRAQLVPDPTGKSLLMLGRFGWKAEKVSVAHQVADALSADLGVSTPLFPEPSGDSELQGEELAALVTYMRLLALPGRRDMDDLAVMRGEELFHSIGCGNCHASEMSTGTDHPFVELRNQVIRPYTDLLLHDMGPDLADGSGRADASEWRTPPLWGLGSLLAITGERHLLHDGRARDPLEAVLWHGGEAAFARAALIELGAADRAALLAFLNSL